MSRRFRIIIDGQIQSIPSDELADQVGEFVQRIKKAVVETFPLFSPDEYTPLTVVIGEPPEEREEANGRG